MKPERALTIPESAENGITIIIDSDSIISSYDVSTGTGISR